MNLLSDQEDNASCPDDDGPISEGYFEEINAADSLTLEINACIKSEMSASSLVHGIIAQGEKDSFHVHRDLVNMIRTDIGGPQFEGPLVDTGANRSSIMIIDQYKLYCKEHWVSAGIDTGVQKTLHGVGGSTKTVGQSTIIVPMPDLGIQTPVVFHIVDSSLPSILCLKDLREMGVYISIQEACLLLDGKKQKITVTNGLLFHKWSPEYVIFYTKQELRKLRRSFGHPSVRALTNLLHRARSDEPDVYDELMRITKSFPTCQKNATKPRRFKLTFGTEDSRFNHIVAVDVFYIDGKPVLHCVYEATHFAAAQFLPPMSSKDVWKVLKTCWMQVCLGPPDFLRVDKGSNFVSKEFNSNAEVACVTVLQAPVESPETISHVERYHAQLRSVYNMLINSLPAETEAELLQLAVMCVNDIIGPEGLCPTLLVFGANPRPARNAMSPTQLQRSVAINDAMKTVLHVQAARRVHFGLKHRGPYGGESSSLSGMFPGSLVLVYRKKQDKWEGPLKFIDHVGETVCVQLPRCRQIFRSSSVKPFHGSDDTIASTDDAPSASTEFKESRHQELPDQEARGAFEVVDQSTVPRTTRIYGTRWVDTKKKDESGSTQYKSRLVAQTYRDKCAASIPTKSPTVTRWSQRIFLTIAAMCPERSTYVRDVTQAYLQSESDLCRPVYLRPPPEMHLPDGKVLIAKKPLYGIPESGRLWFETYHRHRIDTLDMRACISDPCLLYGFNDQNEVPNITVLQVDDSLGYGTAEFLAREDREVHRFQCNPRKLLTDDKPQKFNGMFVTRTATDTYNLLQSDKLVNATPRSDAELVALRARFQSVAGCSRLDIAGAVQLFATDVRQPRKETYGNFMDEINGYCRKTRTMGLNFVRLDMHSLHLVAFTDAAFANAPGNRSQLGFVLVAMDTNDAANIVHFGSSRCRRVALSIVTAELLALMEGFDATYTVKHAIGEILQRDVPLDIFTDSRTAFNVVAKHAGSLEKRLQIDVFALRESHCRQESRQLGWIAGAENPADGLTRLKELSSSHPLRVLMNTNRLTVKPSGWTTPRKPSEETSTNADTQNLKSVRFPDDNLAPSVRKETV